MKKGLHLCQSLQMTQKSVYHLRLVNIYIMLLTLTLD